MKIADHEKKLIQQMHNLAEEFYQETGLLVQFVEYKYDEVSDLSGDAYSLAKTKPFIANRPLNPESLE